MKRKTAKYPAPASKAQARKEAAASAPQLVNVRAAKDHLSSLLEQTANGNEIIITSDGLPKAKLVPFVSKRKPFRVDWKLLRSTPLKAGEKSAQELVREDRDGRA